MIPTLSLLYLTLLLGVGVAFEIGQDRLLFRSGAGSLLGMLLACSALLFALLALPGAWLARRPASRARLQAALTRACTGLLVFGFLLFTADAALQFLDDRYDFFDELPALPAALLSLAFVALVFALARAYLRRLPERPAAAGLTRAAVAISLCGLLASGALLARRAWPAPPATGPGLPNLVFVMVDGLGAEYLPVTNPQVENAAFQRVADKARVFTQLRTNHPFTHGYFGALYSGRRDGRASGANLWALLQEAGVRTRWVAYHNNGIPDVHDLPYAGLRSAYVGEHYAFIPRWFGLDYNVLRYQGFRSRGRPVGEREVLLNYLLNLPHDVPHVLDDLLVEEVEDLRARGGPFFLLVHAEKKLGRPYWKALKAKHVTGRSPADRAPDKDLRERIDEQDNEYPPEAQATVDAWRAERIEAVFETAVQALERLFATYEERGWNRDTLLVVTSDHGYMLGKGRVGYHYHVDEEAVRVPLLVAGGDLSGRDDRPFETIDLTRTLLQHFGVDVRLSDDAVSLLEPGPGKAITSSLAEEAENRGAWELAVYDHREQPIKYTVDLLGDLQARRARLEGFDALPEPGGPAPFALADVLRDYGVLEEVLERREELALEPGGLRRGSEAGSGRGSGATAPPAAGDSAAPGR